MKSNLLRAALALLALAGLPGCAAHRPPKAALIVPARCVQLLCREADGCYCDPITGHCYNAHSQFSCTEVAKPKP